MKAFVAQFEPADLLGIAVVRDERRDGGHQCDGGRDQRLGNAWRTVASVACCTPPSATKVLMIPHTVPNRPT